MSITYKTVIVEAINGFNLIQNSLANLGGLDISSVSGSGGSVTTGISADNLVANVKKLAVIKNGSTFYKGNIPIYDPSKDQ